MKRIALCLAALSLCSPLWAAEAPGRCPGLGKASADELNQWANLKVCDHAVWALVYYSNPRNAAAKNAYLKATNKSAILTAASTVLGKTDAKMAALIEAGDAVLSTAAALGLITKLDSQPLAVHVPAAPDKASAVLTAQKFKIAAFAAGDPQADKLDPAQGVVIFGHLLSAGKGKAVAPGQLLQDFNKAVVALNNQISNLIQYKVFKDLKTNLRPGETPAVPASWAASMEKSQKLAEDLAGKAEPAGDFLKALQNISDMDMDKADNIKDLPKKPIMSFLDPVMRNALRVQSLQVGKAFEQAKLSLKGKTVGEATEALKKKTEDRRAEEARQAKISANTTAIAEKMAGLLNEQRTAGALPDASGPITVTAGPQGTDKNQTVFTATDGKGTKAVLKTVPTTDIEKEATPAAAAEKLGTVAAADILNGNFRAARATALKEALTPELAPGADGKVPPPALPKGGVLGPGGMMGGEPGCDAAGGDSLADYKKRLAEDAKKKSAQTSAARQKLEAGYDQKYREIMDNKIMTEPERTAALAELDKPYPAASQALSTQESDNQVAQFEASMRAERQLRAQTAQRVETVRDSWQKDVKLAQKYYSGGENLAQFLTPALVKAYFNEQWAAGSSKYDDNMTAAVGQVKFNNPASVDEFMGKHLAGWCKDRKVVNAPATATDLKRAAELRRQALLKPAPAK
ncbi:MAG: hypothetical protein NTY77_19415 [Elusimicrobia bacterium]|nr:hypothetical protein [Elusimicrobiota bacterium]